MSIYNVFSLRNKNNVSTFLFEKCVLSRVNGLQINKVFRRVLLFLHKDLRPGSACACLQSDQGLHCPLTEPLDTTNYEWRAKAQMILCTCA